MIGYIHSFESLATLDGEGVRFGIFLKGCPLRCIYCHNPDTWSGDSIETDALSLVKKAVRYKPYFGEKGGVTFSGGEPLLQAEFLCECIPHLTDAEIKYTVDTSGAVVLDDKVKAVLDNAQLVILDLKFCDDDSYLRYTGQNMKNTIDTLYYLDKIKKRTWVRTVIIPGINDSEESLAGYLDILKNMKCVERYELLGFHTMGFLKYESLNIKNPLESVSNLDKDVLERLQNFVDESFEK